MADPIRIEIDNRAVLEALDRLAKAGHDLRPALDDIGEKLVESTKQRFVAGVAPDGARWAPNAQATIEAFLRQKSGTFDKRTGGRTGNKAGYFRKDGRITAKSAAVVAGKRPLHGESGSLAEQIHARVSGNELVVGSSMVYAAMQHFGGTKAKWPHLWGDIPARPFLGLSADDENQVLDIIRDHLSGAFSRP